MTAPPILETRGLTCRFGGVTAVDNVDLAIAEGELRCLIGPNGAGKSTLFKCMTRQLRATSGDILLRGQSVVGSYPHQIARRGGAIEESDRQRLQRIERSRKYLDRRSAPPSWR